MPKRSRDTLEPSAFFHIGRRFNQDQFRFFDSYIDFDTKPYLEQLAFMNYTKDDVTNASDSFDQLEQFVEHLIKENKAYVDFTNSYTIMQQRFCMFPNNYRDESPSWSLAEFEKMKNGMYSNNTARVRLKIDVYSPNYLLRDPTAYEISLVRIDITSLKTQYIYPTYEFAHPVLDAICQYDESYCPAKEYGNYKDLYEWISREIPAMNWKPAVLLPWIA